MVDSRLGGVPRCGAFFNTLDSLDLWEAIQIADVDTKGLF